MKVAIAVTLDIDPEAWHQDYGTSTVPTAVREDVISFVLTALHALAAQEAGILSVEQKKR